MVKILVMIITAHLLVACKGGNSKIASEKALANSSPQASNSQSFQSIRFNNSDIQEFTQEFYEEASKRGISLHHTKEILIVDKSASSVFSNSQVAGVCFHRTGADNEKILMLNTAWYAATYIQKKDMIFHELGHCALDRLHDSRVIILPSTTTLSYPLSIMNPYVFWDDGNRTLSPSGILSVAQFKINFWKNYVDQLFTNKDGTFAFLGDITTPSNAASFRVVSNENQEGSDSETIMSSLDEYQEDNLHCVIEL